MKTFVLTTLTALLALPALAAETPDLAPQRAAATALLQQLGTELKKEIAANGPEGAIGVCKELAPRIAGDLSRKEGWKLTRVSLKPRNPMLGTPDAWEQQALQQFDARAAAGDKPETLEIVEVVQEPAGRYLRYAKAIPVQSQCLACHGGAGDIKPAVQARLAESYPFDRATGYALGTVRGAISIKQPLAEAAAK
jgi:hypothetical protein